MRNLPLCSVFNTLTSRNTTTLYRGNTIKNSWFSFLVMISREEFSVLGLVDLLLQVGGMFTTNLHCKSNGRLSDILPFYNTNPSYDGPSASGDSCLIRKCSIVFWKCLFICSVSSLASKFGKSSRIFPISWFNTCIVTCNENIAMTYFWFLQII